MPHLTVVMVEPGYDETIGFVARAMKNFDLANLRLVNPIARIEGRAKMRAGHAQEVLENAERFRSLSEAVADQDLTVGTTSQRARSQYRVLRRPASPRDLAEQIKKASGSVALVFGREGTGLTNQELALCDMTVTIPSSPNYPTLNLSHAAAIIFCELFNTLENDSSDELAPQSVKTIMVNFLEKSARLAGINAEETSLALRAFKNMLGRSALRVREASLLAGVLRNITIALSDARLTSRPDQRAENLLVPQNLVRHLPQV
ncbi:hypothetical protein AUG19_08885 [archaeon 13_1_20CM_2_54_9]|nr:MAG: hypothetical protein AUG19_08885 [archaeon 13_1_20CM_2_54_9]